MPIQFIPEGPTVSMVFGNRPDPEDREPHIISTEDYLRYDGNRNGTTVVTDVETGEVLEIAHAACGLGCRCAAEIVNRL